MKLQTHKRDSSNPPNEDVNDLKQAKFDLQNTNRDIWTTLKTILVLGGLLGVVAACFFMPALFPVAGIGIGLTPLFTGFAKPAICLLGAGLSFLSLSTDTVRFFRGIRQSQKELKIGRALNAIINSSDTKDQEIELSDALKTRVASNAFKDSLSTSLAQEVQQAIQHYKVTQNSTFGKLMLYREDKKVIIHALLDSASKNSPKQQQRKVTEEVSPKYSKFFGSSRTTHLVAAHEILKHLRQRTY